MLKIQFLYIFIVYLYTAAYLYLTSMSEIVLSLEQIYFYLSFIYLIYIDNVKQKEERWCMTMVVDKFRLSHEPKIMKHIYNEGL